MAGRTPKRVADPEDAGGARRAGLKILKSRLISRAALSGRLRRKGYSKAAVERASDELVRAGVLDDERLAESLVRRQVQAKPAGKVVLVAKLRQRGIAGGLAKEAVEEGLRGRDLLADAVELARRKVRGSKPGLERQVLERRVFAYLARRGFESEVCRSAVERAVGSGGAEFDR